MTHSHDEFLEYKEIGEKLGFRHFESSALVRSSYRARRIEYKEIPLKSRSG